MKLHEDSKLFKEAVRATAQQMEMLDIYIEKDYWVTKALHLIFTSDIGKEVVFKGGTALSKCYRMIDRFSEDVDLVTLRSEEETSAQLKKKLKQISSAVDTIMPEMDVPGITNKLGMIRKTVHVYPKVFEGKYGQVRDKVILESSWLGHYEPYHSQEISSYIYEMMQQKKQEELIKAYEMMPFAVQVLDVKRTFCEKILSLVRFSHTEQPLDDLRMKIRHLYDINRVLEDSELNSFFHSSHFEEMLNRVGKDDVEGYRNNNEWLKHHPKEALVFAKPKETWLSLETTYSKDFQGLVYGVFPAASDVFTTLKNVSQRIAEISWNVKVE